MGAGISDAAGDNGGHISCGQRVRYLSARIVGPSLSELLGQQVIVENVGGAGGITAAYRVARAALDGYQFVLGGTDTLAQSQTLYKTPPYNAITASRNPE